MTNKIDVALANLITRVRAHYGARLGSIYRVERSTLLEETDRSDAEIVVLLTDANWRMLDEQRALGKLTFEALMEHDVYVRAWPVPKSAWEDASRSEHPALVRELSTHAQELVMAA